LTKKKNDENQGGIGITNWVLFPVFKKRCQKSMITTGGMVGTEIGFG